MQAGSYEVSGPTVDPPKRVPSEGAALAFALHKAAQQQADFYVRLGDETLYVVVGESGGATYRRNT